MSKEININLEEKRYFDEPKVHALEKVKLKINPGEFVCILGPNGCGKSTLLKLILGIDGEYDGKINIGNKEVVEPSRNCRIVFQEPRLLPWLSVENNIQFGIISNKTNYKENISQLLKLLHLEKFRNSFPNQLSGGMAQKVGIARALVNAPDVLLLDEPFAALDALTKIKIQEELSGLMKKEKTTVLMVTHDFEEATFLADRIIVFSKSPGKIIKEFKVNIPTPRDRTSKEFLKLHSEILGFIKNVF
tara:strand:- start:193 stop:933 length:741 start_codon:yes stop_codon:yes gene_type:complete